MEIQLQELISKIKEDGLESANKEAADIIEKAQNQANQIISDANAKVKQLMDGIKKEEQLSIQRSENAIANAARDLILNINSTIVSILSGILENNVEKTIQKETLISLLQKAITSLQIKDDVVIELSEKDSTDLAEAIKKEFASQVSQGIEIKPTKTISSGFKIYGKTDSLSYDFTGETIANHLGAYTNSKLAEIIKKSTKTIPV